MVRCMCCGGDFDGDGACGDGVCADCGRLSPHDRSRIADLVTERDKLAEIVTRNDGAVERSQELARELGEALTAKAEVREQLSDMAMSNAQLLLDNLELRTAKAELVAVLEGFEGLSLKSTDPQALLDMLDKWRAALAKHGGDDARTKREARLAELGFDNDRFDPHTGARIEDDDG